MAGEVTFERTESDLIATYRDWFWANLTRRAVPRLWRIGLAIILLVVAGWLANRWMDGVGYPLYGAAGGALIAVPVCWAIGYALLPGRARRLYRQDRTASRDFTWRWSDEGLESRGGNGESRYAWSEIHRWHDGRYTLMFFLNDAFVLYIPHRAASPDQLAELRALAGRAVIARY